MISRGNLKFNSLQRVVNLFCLSCRVESAHQGYIAEPTPHMQNISSYSREIASGYPGASSLVSKALISAGIFVLTIWSVSLFSNGSAYSDTPATPDASTLHFDATPFNVPSPNAQVTPGLLEIYQWEPDCPLAGSKLLSLNDTHPHTSHKNRRMTRRVAEKSGYSPCVFCADIEFWRAVRRSNSARTLTNKISNAK